LRGSGIALALPFVDSGSRANAASPDGGGPAQPPGMHRNGARRRRAATFTEEITTTGAPGNPAWISICLARWSWLHAVRESWPSSATRMPAPLLKRKRPRKGVWFTRYGKQNGNSGWKCAQGCGL